MSKYRLGAHSTVALGGGRVAVISRDTRGWAILGREDYDTLTEVFREKTAEIDDDAGAEPVLERLYRTGLLLRNGAYFPGSIPALPATPDALLLKMTGQCNLACTYCYDYSEQRCNHNLDPERAVATIDRIVARTGRLTVTFHGGEPLLRFKEMKTIVAHCENLKKNGAVIRYSLQTNGTLLDEENITFLETHQFSVGISLDGIEADTDRLRQCRKENNESPSDMIRRLLRDHGPFIRKRCGILAVLCATSLPHLPAFALWLQDQGIGGLSTTVVDLAGRAAEMNSEAITPEALVGLYACWLDMIRKGRIHSLALTNLVAFIDNLCSFDPPSFCQKGPCGAAGDFLVIDADGSFRACDCVIDPFFLLGGPESTPEEILRTDSRCRIMQRESLLQTRNRCTECPWIRICGGTCVAKAIGCQRNVNDIYEPECAVNRFLYPELLAEFDSDPDGPIFRYHRTHSRLYKKKHHEP